MQISHMQIPHMHCETQQPRGATPGRRRGARVSGKAAELVWGRGWGRGKAGARHGRQGLRYGRQVGGKRPAAARGAGRSTGRRWRQQHGVPGGEDRAGGGGAEAEGHHADGRVVLHHTADGGLPGGLQEKRAQTASGAAQRA